MSDTKPQVGAYRYRCRSTGASSAKYGACEVCGQHASEVFLQSEVRWVEADAHDETPIRVAGGFWTHDACSTLFGHEACLITKRRAPLFEVVP